MDPKTKINYVSDVRLKRFFRDYIIAKYGTDYIWVTKLDGKNVDATKRLEAIGKDPSSVLTKCIDARLFGATIPKKGGEGKGESYVFTGPLQLSWGLFSTYPVFLTKVRYIIEVTNNFPLLASVHENFLCNARKL